MKKAIDATMKKMERRDRLRRGPRLPRRPLANRRRLPEVVRRAAGLVNLAERELDRHAELHLLGIDVRHLEIEPGTVDVHDARDQGRIRAAGEVVEGEGLHRPDAIRQPDRIELLLSLAP